MKDKLGDKYRPGKRVKAAYYKVYGKKSKPKTEGAPRVALKDFAEKNLPEPLVADWYKAKIPTKGKDQPKHIKTPKAAPAPKKSKDEAPGMKKR